MIPQTRYQNPKLIIDQPLQLIPNLETRIRLQAQQIKQMTTHMNTQATQILSLLEQNTQLETTLRRIKIVVGAAIGILLATILITRKS